MENQNQTQNQEVSTPQIQSQETVVKKDLITLLTENKKKIIILAFSIVIFILLLSLIIMITNNVKKVVNINPKTSPVPEETYQPLNTSIPGNETNSSPEKIQISELNNQINQIDKDQSKFTPPQINFKISF